MAGFEEALGSILSDPGAMDQIMALAKSLGAGREGQREEEGPSAREEPPAAPAPEGGPPALDPQLMGLAMEVMGEYAAGGGEGEALLQALRPFLSAKRAKKVDRAIQAARLSHAVRAAWRLMKARREEEEDHV